MARVLMLLVSLSLVGCNIKSPSAPVAGDGLPPVVAPVVSENDEVPIVQVGNRFQPLVPQGQEVPRLPLVEYNGVAN